MVETGTNPHSLVCASCGQLAEPATKFCRRCGAPLVAVRHQPTAPPSSTPPEPHPSPIEQTVLRVGAPPVVGQPAPSAWAGPPVARPASMPLAPADGAQASRAGAISNGPVPGASTAWGSRSLRWVIGSAAALLVLAAGVGAGVLWLNLHGNDPGERPRVVSESSAPVRTPVPAPSASASAASSSGSASAEPAPIEFTCWNGASVLDLRECASPRTEAEAYAYLQYVYPELAGIVASCEPKKGASKYSDIAVYFNCPGDGVTTIRYRYWRNLADAEGHYADDAKKFDGAHPYDVFIGEQRVNGWVRAYNIPENGLLTVTMFIPDQHLSLSIEGKSTDAIWAAFERTTIRPVEETLGHRSGQEASVSVLGRR